MDQDLIIAGRYRIPAADIALSFVRSGGPGGQNVNKVATAVQLRFDLARADLPEAIKTRAGRIAGSRLSADGVIVLTASRFRTQLRNREDAWARLADLLERAAVAPRRRVATRPTLASKRRRVEAKKARSGKKAMRGRVDPSSHG